VSTRPLTDDGVIRRDEQGRWWLLNRRDRGFGEFGYSFASLEELLAAYAVTPGAEAQDEHGTYRPAPRAAAPRWDILEGDALEALAGLPAGSIDAIVTDPPYASVGGESSAVQRNRTIIPRETQFFEAWLREHLAAWDRVLSPRGAVWLTIDWRGALSFDRMVGRFNFRSPSFGVWTKGGLGLGHVVRSVIEPWIVFARPNFERLHTDEVNHWHYQWNPAHRKHGHPAEKPIELMARAIRLVCLPGGTVLDPFAGSGSTGVAAVQEGRRFVGIEREPDFAQIARQRIHEAASGAGQLSIPGEGGK
jgi:site-specific DNA-methyltransferase (adenine-specific)